ncbi:unknown [Prevotella sp. CAG:485]|nr:unknown [Prevotella sp. CAG:485]
MKKVALSLVVLFAAAMVACSGNKENTEAAPATDTPAVEATVDTPVEAAQVDTANKAAAATEAPAAEAPAAEAPATEAPAK